MIRLNLKALTPALISRSLPFVKLQILSVGNPDAVIISSGYLKLKHRTDPAGHLDKLSSPWAVIKIDEPILYWGTYIHVELVGRHIPAGPLFGPVVQSGVGDVLVDVEIVGGRRNRALVLF